MKVPLRGSVSGKFVCHIISLPLHSLFENLNMQENKVGVYSNKYRIMSKHPKYILKLNIY